MHIMLVFWCIKSESTTHFVIYNRLASFQDIYSDMLKEVPDVSPTAPVCLFTSCPGALMKLNNDSCRLSTGMLPCLNSLYYFYFFSLKNEYHYLVYLPQAIHSYCQYQSGLLCSESVDYLKYQYRNWFYGITFRVPCLELKQLKYTSKIPVSFINDWPINNMKSSQRCYSPTETLKTFKTPLMRYHENQRIWVGNDQTLKISVI